MDKSFNTQNQSNNITQTNNIESNIIPKKRGRPRKIFIDGSKNSDKKKIHTDLSQQREIILHLPITMKSTNKKMSSDSDKNKFTIKDSDEETVKSTVLSISDNMSNTEDDDSHDKDIHDLVEQLKNKERIIKKLKDELSTFRSSFSDNNTSAIKENKYFPMNVNFIDNTSGKTIVSEKTDVACWWCTCGFDTAPCFIPERYDNDKYYVFGCFCTFNCAVSYNLNMGDYKIYDRYSLIKKLYQCIFSTDDDIIMAPSKEVLDKYGGPLTINEFRKNFKLCNKEYKMLMPPMVPIIPFVEERNRERTIINKNDTNKYERKTSNFTIFDTFKN